MRKFLMFGIMCVLTIGSVRADYRPALFEYAQTTESRTLPGVINVPYRQIDDLTKTIPTPLPPPVLQLPQENFDQPPPVVTVSQPKPTVMMGDYAASALEWMLPILAPIVAGFIVDALLKVRTALGQTTTAAQRDKLQQMAENAVNLAAHEAGHDLAAKWPVQINSQVMARAVDYVQAHGADTIKKLGLDPTDPKAVEAIRGRVATILANKAQPAAGPQA